MRRAIAFASVVTAVGLGIQVLACGATANDVAACRQIESARCVQAGAMNCVDLSYPIHEGTSTSDNVTACQLFYDDACLHGFVTTAALNTNEVNACLKAIQTAKSCGVVLEPQYYAKNVCAWLIPPDAGVDTGVDAGTVADTGVVVVTPDTGTTADTGNVNMACFATCDSNCAGDPVCIQACEAQCME